MIEDTVAPKFKVGEKLKIYGWAKISEAKTIVEMRERSICTCYDGTMIEVIAEHFMSIEFLDPADGVKHEIYKAQCRRLEN